jgi:hypothetical protein
MGGRVEAIICAAANLLSELPVTSVMLCESDGPDAWKVGVAHDRNAFPVTLVMVRHEVVVSIEEPVVDEEPSVAARHPVVIDR